MKEARYLIRLTNRKKSSPLDQNHLLQEARAAALPLNGKVINLRVTPVALEFDLFCSSQESVQPFLDAFQSLGDVVTSKRLDLPPPAVQAERVVAEARHLFNEHRFWEVHEVLEGLWKERQGSEKNLIQGLILAAAALVHAQKNENAVVWTMLADAQKRLDRQPDLYYGWNIAKFKDHWAHVLAAKKLEIPTV